MALDNRPRRPIGRIAVIRISLSAGQTGVDLGQGGIQLDAREAVPGFRRMPADQRLDLVTAGIFGIAVAERHADEPKPGRLARWRRGVDLAAVEPNVTRPVLEL